MMKVYADFNEEEVLKNAIALEKGDIGFAGIEGVEATFNGSITNDIYELSVSDIWIIGGVSFYDINGNWSEDTFTVLGWFTKDKKTSVREIFREIASNPFSMESESHRLTGHSFCDDFAPDYEDYNCYDKLAFIGFSSVDDGIKTITLYQLPTEGFKQISLLCDKCFEQFEGRK